MRNYHYNRVLSVSLSVLLIWFCLNGCNRSKKEPSDAYGTKSMDSAQNLNRTKFDDPLESQTADYLSRLYLNSLYSLVLSQNALKRPLHKTVKAIANYQVETHKKLNRSLQHIADLYHISLPDNVSNEQQLEIKELAQEKGLDYESNYMNKIIHINKSTYALLQQTRTSSHEQLRNWSKKNIPVIEMLMDTLTAGRKQVDTMQIKSGSAG